MIYSAPLVGTGGCSHVMNYMLFPPWKWRNCNRESLPIFVAFSDTKSPYTPTGLYSSTSLSTSSLRHFCSESEAASMSRLNLECQEAVQSLLQNVAGFPAENR